MPVSDESQTSGTSPIDEDKKDPQPEVSDREVEIAAEVHTRGTALVALRQSVDGLQRSVSGLGGTVEDLSIKVDAKADKNFVNQKIFANKLVIFMVACSLLASATSGITAIGVYLRQTDSIKARDSAAATQTVINDCVNPNAKPIPPATTTCYQRGQETQARLLGILDASMVIAVECAVNGKDRSNTGIETCFRSQTPVP